MSRTTAQRDEIDRRLATTARLVGGLLQAAGDTPDRSPAHARRLQRLERLNRRIAAARRRNLGLGRMQAMDGRHLLPYTEGEIRGASEADLVSIRSGYRYRQEACDDAPHEARRGE